jgi:hypothetical protein
MRRVAKTILKMIAILLGPPVLVMASFFVTGSYSLKYDRGGTWLCYTPTDRMSRSCSLLTQFVPVDRLNDIAPSARGYLRCNEGHWEIGNFDLEARNKSGDPVFNLQECEKP